MKYSRQDVIIWWDDKRLKGQEGKACYCGATPFEAFDNAVCNRDRSLYLGTNSAGMEDEPFLVYGSHGVTAIVFEKENIVRRIPYDFSLKEDRDALMGKRIVTDASDMVVTSFAFWLSRGWELQIDSQNGFSGEYLMQNFVFADTGLPVCKEVTDVDHS